MKFSKQREIIYKQVMEHPVHPTAEEVYTSLRKEYPNLSLGTVYRNLNILSETGRLLKIRIADGSDRFDGRTDRHYHFICDKCGRVFDVEINLLNELERYIRNKDGHGVTAFNLNMSGSCRDCLKTEENAAK